MVHLIDKDALVAEIERRIKSLHQVNSPREQAVLYECEDILSFIDTLEVKEMDLDDYYHKFLDKEWFNATHVRTISEMMAFTAKHFFELGLKAQKGE